MLINVLYFARLREAFGLSGERLELPADSTVEYVIQQLLARGDVWKAELTGGRVVRVAVNQTMATPATALKTGDELALFPPVTGG